VRVLKRFAAGAAIVLAAALVLAGLTLPPRAERIGGPGLVRSGPGAVVRGVAHVHTTRSDGSGTIAEVALAAARAGLDFIILTDHGDATRVPDAPAYRSGVLVLDGVEISTRDGHYLAFGLPAAPYPLAGSARDVVEDVQRLGGLGFAAHPDSPKADLAWRAWHVPVDGFEWLNADSQWRNEPRRALALALLHYPFRGPETIVSLFDRPEALLARWDALSSEGRRLVALAGADAHARIGWQGGPDDYEIEGREPGPSLAVPRYETVFRAFSLRVETDAPFSRHATDDAARLIEGIRAGRIFTVLDGLAGPGDFEFSAEAEGRRVLMGETLEAGESRLLFRVRVQGPERARIVLKRNGRVAAESRGPELVTEADATLEPGEAAAAWRVEVVLEDHRRDAGPWVLGNPIFVRQRTPASEDEVPAPSAGPMRPLLDVAAPARGWLAEHDARSTAAATEAGESLVFRFALAPVDRRGWAALARGEPGLGSAQSLEITARSDRPMRLAVQLRAPDAGHDLRWSRSVYLDETARTVRIPIDELEPVSDAAAETERTRGDALLLVVDRTHAAAGARGTVWVEKLRLVEPDR
jgi:hypothetical protein